MRVVSRPSFTMRLFRRWLYGIAAMAIGACGMSAPGSSASTSAPALTSSSGATGPSGPTGATGPMTDEDGRDERDASDARHDRDDMSGRKARAMQGLAISPVPLSLDGRTGKEKMLIGLGSYIVNAASDCAGCHSGPAGFLSGGVPFFLGGGQVVWTRNLTPDAATGLALTHDQFIEAIRTGRDFHEGATKMLVVMPWTTLRWSSDVDLDAIFAYLRAVPAVKNGVPPDVKNGLPLPQSIPFDLTMYTDGDVTRKLKGAHQSFSARRGLSISPLALANGKHGDDEEDKGGRGGRSVGIGSYIVNTFAHCNDCHTNPDRTADGSKVNTASFLTGGTVFKTPPSLQPLMKYVRATSANLEGVTHGFFQEPGISYARFRDIIRTGTLVDETPPRPLAFPMSLVAPNLAKLLEDDLRAVYDYAMAVPATPGAFDVPHQAPARWCAAASDCASGESCTSGECTGGACNGDLDCGTCQTCLSGGSTCLAPAPSSICVLTAQ
jgi:hypothetical protein